MKRNSMIVPGNPRVLPVTGDKGTTKLDVLFKSGIDLSLVDERVAGKFCDISVPAPPGWPKKVPIDYFPPYNALASRTCEARIAIDGKITIPATLHVVKNIRYDVVIGANDMTRDRLRFAFDEHGMAISRGNPRNL